MAAAASAAMNGMHISSASPPAAATSPPRQAPDITSFNVDTKRLNGFERASGRNVKQSVAALPAVQGQLIATGTDDPEAKEHFLKIVNGETMLSNATLDPVVSSLPVPEHMSDVKWLNSSMLVAACGKGNLRLFNYSDNALKHIGQ